MKTKDGLTIYDLDPNASELWAVAGPEGYDVSQIDPDNLPDGFRWITEDEWQALAQSLSAGPQIRFSADGHISIVWDNGEPVRCPTQHDMDTLPVGEDLTDEEIEQIED